jgi:hypothetical protein
MHQPILNLHNKYRADHGGLPLTWDATLAKSATEVAATCNFKHSGLEGIGECRMSQLLDDMMHKHQIASAVHQSPQQCSLAAELTKCAGSREGLASCSRDNVMSCMQQQQQQ